ncbi:MAG: putative thioesterase [Bacteriovoracaceae bacterium]|nr:putative thioesterase [Bacteriovoracaceae bacterium]
MLSSMKSPWFYRLKPRPHAQMRLFVFPHAGGSSLSYSKWRDLAPENVELIVVELPGHGARHREKLLMNFKSLIEDLKAAFESEGDTPSVFFGHSMGSLIAFELYRALHSPFREKIRGLALSSFRPPSQKNLREREKIAHLPETELIEKLSQFAPVAPEILRDSAARTYFLKILRADIALMEAYETEDIKPLSVPLLVFGGADDSSVKPEELKQWADFGTILHDVQIFPGGHFYHFEHAKSVFLSLTQNFFV